MQRRVLVLLICLAGFWGLLGWHGGAGADELDYSPLCQELEKSGLQLLNSGSAYGIPFVEIKVPLGASVTSICRSVPSLRADFNRCRDQISFFNALHPLYIKNNAGESNSLEADILRIPLDLTLVPEIFPAFDDSLASSDQYILVDIGKGFLGLYIQGELQRVFPISGGTPEKATPLTNFTITEKYKEHWSNIYDTWMPWALLIKRPYYIHGGALPGKRDSAGCIRLFPRDAKELYHLVAVGTPGRIIETSPLELTSPAFFCH